MASAPEAAPAARASVQRRPYGVMPDGRIVEEFTLRAGAIEVRAISYGAIITDILAPDRDGHRESVVLGHDALAGYVGHSPYFGAVIGRHANRIAGGRFTLDGVGHQLDTNDGPNHLHGGFVGFDKQLWTGHVLTTAADAAIRLELASPDGDAGYPGTLQASVTYLLSAGGTLVVDYHATCDQPTVVNLTQHSYFNLAGPRATDILSHELAIVAEHYSPVGAGLIPTGAMAPVHGSAFDFLRAHPIGERVGDADEQLALAGGYDHNFVLSGAIEHGLRHAARACDPVSGRTLSVHTDQPGLQFYSGNFLDGSIVGRGGQRYAHRSGFCLETQHYPDSPNHPSFPSVVLAPGDEYASRTTFTFGTDRDARSRQEEQ
ncbi:MAG: galactose-epimerase [Gemmatimonadetes bacterium]|nr:galactose-epimerase [Gemmatimonadota bacterium]